MSNTLLHIDSRKKLLPLEIAKRYSNSELLPDWLKKIIKDGILAIEDLPIPDAKTESWREANLGCFFNPKIEWIHSSTLKDMGEVKFHHLYSNNFEPNIVYVNGKIVRNNLNYLSSKGVNISTLSERYFDEGGFLDYLLNEFRESRHFFEAVSRAFLFDGLVIEIPPNIVIDTPINIYFPVPEVNSNVLDTPWFILILNANSQAKVSVHYIDNRENPSSPVWINASELIKVGANSHLKYLSTYSGYAKTYRFVSTNAQLDKDSSIIYNSLLLDGKFIRSELNVELVGENGYAEINGLSLSEKVNYSEVQQSIGHLKPNCTSRINWRGIGKDEGKTVYRGKIYIAPGAQKSDSIQLFKGLCLSDRAIVDAKPQLEIYADDVRCTHGATVGPPPQELVFYFQARGIDKIRARKLLVSAFVKQVLKEIPFSNVIKLVEPYLGKIYE